MLPVPGSAGPSTDGTRRTQGAAELREGEALLVQAGPLLQSKRRKDYASSRQNERFSTDDVALN